MSINNWLIKNTCSLHGKTIAVTGTTGGIGRELCAYLAALGASLVLLDRNPDKSSAFASELKKKYGVEIHRITLDLESIENVIDVTNRLKKMNIDFFIHNAGAYSIPRHKCSSGFDNVFQINFVSPYYIIKELSSLLLERNGGVVVVGSIAHNYSKIDKNDIDFTTRSASSKVYGNAKRWLMCSMYSKILHDDNLNISVTHPGISFTGITAHYPKLIFALIKHPMKLIFMKPRKAALSVLRGVFDKTDAYEWIGPCLFDIWGLPKRKKLKTISDGELSFVGEFSEKMYVRLREEFGGKV